jgi:hypothetical protein
MTATLVQTKTAFSDAGATPSATFTSTPTSGNILECRVSWDKNAVSCATPAGWTLVQSYFSSAVGGAWFRKVSDGTEGTVTLSPGANRPYQMCLFEWSGIDSFDVSATANSGATAVTSQASGTTATTANANSTLMAFFGSDSRGNTDAGAAFTNSFTDEAIDPGGASGTSGFYNARREVSSTSTYSTTYSTSGGGDQMFGMIAVYYLASGGLSITPTGLSSAEAFGTAVIGRGAVSITPNGIASAEAFGTAVLSSLYTITASAIATAEAFGTAALSAGAVSVLPSGIATAEAIGAAVLSNGFAILPLSIESLEALGNPVLTVGNVTILPAGIASSETIGAAVVGDVIIVADIAFINDLVLDLVKDIAGRLNG